MNPQQRTEILERLDFERQTIVFPGMTRAVDAGVIRFVDENGESAEIGYSSNSEEEIDEIIRNQVRLAQIQRYDLEWKLYGHDRPSSLRARLTAAGFEAGDREAFLVLPISEMSLALFGEPTADIRRITEINDLRDYQTVREEVSGASCASEMEAHRRMLENHPNHISVYVAYVDNQPAACGRTYFHDESQFAGLYGGQTRKRFRNRGLFTQIVAARIREAVDRGVLYVSVDALPTSEPILRKRGFEFVTYTQPFTLTAR